MSGSDDDGFAPDPSDAVDALFAVTPETPAVLPEATAAAPDPADAVDALFAATPEPPASASVEPEGAADSEGPNDAAEAPLSELSATLSDAIDDVATTPEDPAAPVDVARTTPPDVAALHAAMAPPAGAPSSGTQMFVSARVRDEGRIERLLPDGQLETMDFDSEILIGRAGEGMSIADDPYLSDRHARIQRRDGAFFIEDLDSVNGTFLRLNHGHQLAPGDQIMIGGQIFEYAE